MPASQPQFTVRLHLPPPKVLAPERIRRELHDAFPAPPSGSLLVRMHEETGCFPLRSPFRIGAAAENDLAVESDYISANHCELRNVSGSWIISDLESANGTWLNGERVESAVVADDAVIQIGHLCCLIHFCEDPDS